MTDDELLTYTPTDPFLGNWRAAVTEQIEKTRRGFIEKHIEAEALSEMDVVAGQEMEVENALTQALVQRELSRARTAAWTAYLATLPPEAPKPMSRVQRRGGNS